MKQSHETYNKSAIPDAKDQVIVLLREQILLLQQDRETTDNLLREQDQLIIRQHQHLCDKDLQLASYQQTILQQVEQLSQYDQLITNQHKQISTQQQHLDKQNKELSKLDMLRHELRIVKKWIYGIKSEKRHASKELPMPVDVIQGKLSLDVDDWGVCHINSRKLVAAHIRTSIIIAPKKRGGRHDLPEGLEEEITVLNVENLPVGARLLRIEEQRQLACSPLRWYIKVTRRPVYIAPCEDGLYAKQFVAPLPKHPIPRCKVDISVLVMLLIDKFLYHMPVWRQQRRFVQYGITLSYSTLSYFTNRVCDILEPLWHLLLKEILSSRHLHFDESCYKVLDDTRKKGRKSHLGWMWAMMSPVQRIAGFTYQEGRGKKDIAKILSGYRGYLLTDGYGVYTSYGKQPGVIHQQCLVHVRRYFMQALNYDSSRAGYALDNFFKPLYAIEAACKALNLDYDQITEKRQAESVPVLLAMRQWLEQQAPGTIPGTPMHKAITYALTRFDALMIYTTDGMLEADNNLLEAQIRPLALGRHNHMFAGSHLAGKRAAIIYSLLATCRLQGVNPIKWLDDVLRKITDHPKDKYLELLPQNWKSSNSTHKSAV